MPKSTITVALGSLLVGMLTSRAAADEGKYLKPLADPTTRPVAGSDVGDGRFLMRDAGKDTDPIFRILGDYPSVRGSLGRLMGDRRDPNFKDPEGKVVAFEVLKNGDVLFGPNVGIARRPANPSDPNSRVETNPQHTSPIDFYWDATDRKLHVRSILLTENGDPADLAFRRSGDETYPYGPPLAIKRGTNLGTMYWMGWGAPDFGFNNRVAQLYAKAAEDITSSGAGGSIHLATTAIGSLAPVDRMTIGSDGNVGVGTVAPAARLHVASESGGGFAEDYPSTETLEPGDVVSVDDKADSLTVVRAERAYDARVIGVVADAPAVRVSRADPAAVGKRGVGDTIAGYPVAHGGRVTVKVNAENGPIRPGDVLAASSTPGVAMRATSKGAIVGKALQRHDGNGVGRILMLVDVTWYQP